MFSVGDNDILPLSSSIDVAFFLQVELGLQQSSEEKVSGIFIPCGMSS